LTDNFLQDPHSAGLTVLSNTSQHGTQSRKLKTKIPTPIAKLTPENKLISKMTM
jgi:hypothetical protein